MVVAVRVIMLIELRRRVFQLSRCSPMLWCISTLSTTASNIAYISKVAMESLLKEMFCSCKVVMQTLFFIVILFPGVNPWIFSFVGIFLGAEIRTGGSLGMDRAALIVFKEEESKEAIIKQEKAEFCVGVYR
ncbi:hypothetical protein SLE2022_393460 [Rubroshorea leprosula]